MPQSVCIPEKYIIKKKITEQTLPVPHCVININGYLKAYTKFGHRFLRKLVCMKPGSRQPTVRAGEPAE